MPPPIAVAGPILCPRRHDRLLRCLPGLLPAVFFWSIGEIGYPASVGLAGMLGRVANGPLAGSDLAPAAEQHQITAIVEVSFLQHVANMRRGRRL